MAVIFQEFQRNASKRRRSPRAITHPSTGFLPEKTQPIEFGRLAAHRLAQGGTDDATRQLLEEAKAHVAELMRRIGPDPSRQLEEGERLEEYLREYRATKPTFTSGKGRVSGGEADRDLADIFREFQRRVSKRYQGPRNRTRVGTVARIGTEAGRRRPGNGGGRVKDGMEDLSNEWLNQATAYAPDSVSPADSAPVQDRDRGDQVEEYLQEYDEMQPAEDEEWNHAEEAEQDLENILEEFQGRISKQGQGPRNVERADTDAGDEDLTEIEPQYLEPHETSENSEDRVEEGTDDPVGQLEEEAKADPSESIQGAGSAAHLQKEQPVVESLSRDDRIEVADGEPQAAGNEDQDLTSIFQEYHAGGSEKDESLSETEGTQGGFLPQQTDDPIRQLYGKAKAFVLESIRRAGANRAPDLDEGARMAGQIIDSLAEQTDLLLIATEKTQPFSLGGHCVNVCIMALRIAQTLEYSRGRCVHVGLAALLHEIGVVRAFSRQIELGLDQPTLELRQRPVFSAEILEKLCPEQDWLFLTVGQVSERQDGSGFPLGLEGKDIREEAKIVGIADLLESCIHDRPYRKAMTGYQVMTDMSQIGAQSFSTRVVKALISSFSIYMYNEYVVLNTGEVGRVTEVNPRNVMRPEIELLYDREGKALAQQRVVDLTHNTSRYVIEAIHPDDLPLKRTSKGRHLRIRKGRR